MAAIALGSTAATIAVAAAVTALKLQEKGKLPDVVSTDGTTPGTPGTQDGSTTLTPGTQDDDVPPTFKLGPAPKPPTKKKKKR